MTCQFSEQQSTSWRFTSVDLDGKVTDVSFESDAWTEALQNFVLFLRSNGYYIKDNSIGVNVAQHKLLNTDDLYHLAVFEDAEESL